MSVDSSWYEPSDGNSNVMASPEFPTACPRIMWYQINMLWLIKVKNEWWLTQLYVCVCVRATAKPPRISVVVGRTVGWYRGRRTATISHYLICLFFMGFYRHNDTDIIKR